MDASTTFVEEIDFKEITLDKVVGKGTYGLVRKGKWRGKDVAIKQMETENEKQAFFIEVCLVMEFAEGGSLYNVLHCSPQVEYTAAHAISWVLQCARGVAYLHNMKPKALIHRDLKPPNLLLIMGGTILKICDFGTACDQHTVMTNNKGSAAWMAPEVFECCSYSEKCDVFSWGIILWEVLTRRKPFDEIGGPAFRLMWAVHIGQRPPLIEGCPKPLEELMTRCWSKDPIKRPSMSEIEEQLEELFQFFKNGADEPIINSSPDVYDTTDDESIQVSQEDPLHLEKSQAQEELIIESSNKEPSPLAVVSPKIIPPRPSRTSAPASLSSSQENLRGELVKNFFQIIIMLCYIKYFIFIDKSHHRTGSGSFIIKETSQQNEFLNQSIRDVNIQNTDRTSSSHPKEQVLPQESPDMPRRESWSFSSGYNNDGDPSDWNAYLLLEPKLQPLPPAPSSKESVEIFETHKKMAKEYLHVQTEIKLLAQRK
ncbi:mitogen-activated protein kinase kinase kinase 7-like [Centruroides sculpturatus]|uniref:mitogen-activated protein kinase kinase kinase 7-like n=1 Tax=Centruroides sculpturatus TaxID=218467 RepID=UPI000C6D8844|nr:mitogen-activated protein kinase kinase kinase 7-like [Centruroides sculpturatus]